MNPLDYIRPYARIIEAVAIGAVVIYIAVLWHRFVNEQQQIGYDRAVAEYTKAEADRIKGMNDALEATAREIAKVKVVQQTINKQLEVQTREVPVYKDCVNTQAVMQTINAAARGGVK